MQTNNSKEKVRQLQNKLYLTAKKCDSRRFHALYDKVYRDDVLFEAWKRVKANKGSSGVDGVKIEDVEAMGIEKYLSEIKSELMNGKYKPSPVKRVMIPKPDGSERPLGIPTVKDRIVQMATKIAIEPVFEADFRECSYGFRPKRSAKQALEVVRKACNNKGYYVVDADIEKFFDNVNQGKLMKLVEQRISDRRILKLIKQWLVSGVLYGNVLTISELGTSQGSVISPLLANIYLNTLDRLWEKYGHTHGILVRYADDTVIICKNKKSANHALNLLQYIMVKLDLKLHPVKTKIVSMWDGKEGFDFLGMHHRRMTTETRKGQLYKETYQYPSRKAMKKMKAEVKRNVNRRSLLVAKEEDLIKNLNPKITGWKNYYSTKRNEKWMQALDWYIICTFTRWYNKKHQRRNRMSKVGFVRNSIYEKGLKKMARASTTARNYTSVDVRESDFIWTPISEEFGFIGCMVVLALLSIIIIKCFLAAKNARDYMGMMIAVGIGAMFCFQTFFNIGVATSLLPNTGLPLPFLSNGLTSLISNMMAIGILLNVGIQPNRGSSSLDF